MSLPPGFLDELRTRTSLAQVAGRKLTWDARKTNPGKGDYWAPCPFHQEKTASFHLDDRKGFYYCFGCHAKGDALAFVRETENVGFMEAVEILTREAGMTMPARDPKAREKSDLRQSLADVMDIAVQYYRLQLKTNAGSAARDYLERRGLSGDTIDTFGIGYAPDTRTALVKHLVEKNVPADKIIAAGLAIKPDDGAAPFDRFRGRIMYPIRDARGRCIAFGARAMNPDARAKYLNSPETPLFDKGRTLYNLQRAREASGKSGELIVTEGYMDVIALTQGGFPNAVAPLGTAITEHQLALLWRLAPEPIIALDGDNAGLRAAMRLIDIALPLLEPGRSLRFCLMPEGLDPDDLIKTQGAAAMRALLDRARPMVDLLWQRETQGHQIDSPERRAALDRNLKTALKTIRDASVRAHYTAAIREMRADFFKPNRPERGRKPFGKAKADLATPDAKSSLLAQSERAQDQLRESIVLAIICTHPTAAAPFETRLEKILFRTPGYGKIRDTILSVDKNLSGEDIQAKIDAEIGPGTLEKLMSLRHVRIAPALGASADAEKIEMALAEELAKLEADRGSAAEIEDAIVDMSGRVDEGLTWRLGQAAEAKQKAARTSMADAESGDEEHKNLSQQLQNLIDRQVWVKKKN